MVRFRVLHPFEVLPVTWPSDDPVERFDVYRERYGLVERCAREYRERLAVVFNALAGVTARLHGSTQPQLTDQWIDEGALVAGATAICRYWSFRAWRHRGRLPRLWLSGYFDTPEDQLHWLDLEAKELAAALQVTMRLLARYVKKIPRDAKALQFFDAGVVAGAALDNLALNPAAAFDSFAVRTFLSQLQHAEHFGVSPEQRTLAGRFKETLLHAARKDPRTQRRHSLLDLEELDQRYQELAQAALALKRIKGPDALTVARHKIEPRISERDLADLRTAPYTFVARLLAKEWGCRNLKSFERLRTSARKASEFLEAQRNLLAECQKRPPADVPLPFRIAATPTAS